MNPTPKEPIMNYLVMEKENYKIRLQKGFNTIKSEQRFMLTLEVDEGTETRYIFFDRKDLISLREAVNLALRDLEPAEQS
jgi:hypothetical protein